MIDSAHRGHNYGYILCRSSNLQLIVRCMLNNSLSCKVSSSSSNLLWCSRNSLLCSLSKKNCLLIDNLCSCSFTQVASTRMSLCLPIKHSLASICDNFIYPRFLLLLLWVPDSSWFNSQCNLLCSYRFQIYTSIFKMSGNYNNTFENCHLTIK